MKRIIGLIILALLVVRCSEDFLDLAPISNSNVANFYQSESDFENAIVGAYATLQTDGVFNDFVQLVGDMRSDNSEMGTTAGSREDYIAMDTFTDNVTSSISEGIWDDNYLGVSRVNQILDEVDGLESEDLKTRYKGDCYFLRALFYFNLVRVFGDVPLVTERLTSIEEAYSKGRTDKDEVYKQIIEDLTAAEADLPETVENDEIGRATSGAAAALLGRVYLTIQDYADAKTALEKVINSNVYSLVENYADLWGSANKNNSESIFDVQFDGSNSITGSQFGVRYAPYNYPYNGTTSGGYNIPTEDMVAAYEENDLRKDASLSEYYVNKTGDTIRGLEGRFCVKYLEYKDAYGGSDNWPVIRYADVLLMYSEVLNEISFEADGNAFYYLNLIRKRAGLPEKTAGNSNPDLSVNTQEEFRLAMEQERRVELAFEGHRWYDLLRTGRTLEVLNAMADVEVKDYMLLMPIPQVEIDINPEKITQNPGY